MKEINFYSIEDDVNVFLYNFLSEIVNQNKRVMIFSESPEKMAKLDETLWTMKKTGFLPHLLVNDAGAEKTPVIISNLKNNKNNSNFILISTFLDDSDFLNTFEKTFYIFSPINKTLINDAKNAWDKYSKAGFSTRLLKKDFETGKWKQYNDFAENNLLI